MQRILNYVWINRCAQAADTRRNPIPEYYCDNVIALARRYPDMNFMVWIDLALLTQASREMAIKRFSDAGLGNICVRDLHEIPAYAMEPLFQELEISESGGENIWKRVDLARLIVLEHVMQTENAQNVFYSDLDIVDPDFYAPRLSGIFNQYGMIFGSLGCEPIENAFMGFDRTQVEFLSSYLLPLTRDSIVQDFDSNGFAAFTECAGWHAKSLGISVTDLTFPAVELNAA